MKRYSHLHYFAAAATTAEFAAIRMCSRPHIRYGRFQGRRGYSDKDPGPQGNIHPEFVSGDSHYNSVQDANRGFRSLNSSGQLCYNSVPLPPQNYNGQHFYGPRTQPGMRTWQQSHRTPPVHVGPPFGDTKQFRGQLPQQPFRPKNSKPPDYRAWEYANQGPPAHCERFAVLSYNILADYLALDHIQLYSHVPRYILDWSWRMRSISFELGLWSADILCFQEVDRFQDIESELKLHGYSGIWKMRTGVPVDGCATFWRISRFKLLHEESIEYNKIGLRDNVAQICVLESLNGQTMNREQSTPSTRSDKSNRVVVCNIHVLYNPKRGDIKLGQIRVLLQRAQVVSNLWDDAPIVICGDFNCTPKSPIYNFISEKKLDLSELSRDKVSGQALAEIHPSRPSYNNVRPKYADDFTQVSAVYPKNLELGSFSPDVRNLTNFNGTQNASLEASHLTPSSVVDETSRACANDNHMIGRANQLPTHDASDNCAGKTDDVASSESYCEDVRPEAIDSRHNDSEDATSNVRNNLSQKYVELNVLTMSDAPDYQNKNFVVAADDNTFKTTGTFDSDVSQLERPPDSLSPDFLNVSLSNSLAAVSSVAVANDNQDNLLSDGHTSYDSTSSDLLDNNLERLSLYEVVNETEDDKFYEDRGSFLSELHSTTQSSFAANLNSSSTYEKLNSWGDEALSDTRDVNLDMVVDGGKQSYISLAWTPMEIQTATGNVDCKVMEHSLKLSSAYAEVQDGSCLRDPSGEPLATSYHRKFLGTVDYIWLSEGLTASKVLAPIPKHVMQETPGFPTKKWGSDHFALVSELAFIKDENSEISS